MAARSFFHVLPTGAEPLSVPTAAAHRVDYVVVVVLPVLGLIRSGCGSPF